MIEAYRLHSSRYPANSGKGAALHGGRWNYRGVEAIYTAQSRSLAALEILVHYSVLPKDFVCTPVRFPDSLIYKEIGERYKGFQLPLDVTIQVGTNFLERLRSAVLSVPSSIIPQEWNYVLNPTHSDFHNIEFLASEPFHFDPRLKAVV